MKDDSCTVTILMPVFNGATYLGEAIDSILSQSYHNFTLMIINDGSTDESLTVIKSYQDDRIKIINNHNNLGLIDSLNIGIKEIKCDYIVRMDADDICYRDRLREQIEFMDNNLNVDICGSDIEIFPSKRKKILHQPCDHDDICSTMLFYSAIMHPSVIMRTKSLKKIDFSYSKFFKNIEDFEAFSRLGINCKLANIAKPLLKYRISENSITGQININNEHLERCYKVYKRQLAILGINANLAELEIHYQISHLKRNVDIKFLKEASTWLLRLLSNNQSTHIYKHSSLEQIVGVMWFRICSHAAKSGFVVYHKFWDSPLSRYCDLSLITHLKFLLKTILRLK